jgi:uncharacterized protein YcbK (DUF882 family)
MTDEVPATYEEAPAGRHEAAEAQGVAEVEMQAAPLSPDEAAELDRQTLDDLPDEERRALEEIRAELEQEEGPAAGTALSANFSLSEFHCCRGHCARANVPSSAVPAVRRLVRKVLQPLRNEFGECSVNSGFRNKAHNEHVGGVADSRHRYDLDPSTPAADVTFATGTPTQWAAEARRLLPDVGGIGRYPSQNFVHVDLGPKDHWDG